jgi:type 1 glutamine amidotransferase
MKIWSKLVVLAAMVAVAGSVRAEDKVAKVLLLTGGCCHDYPAQKDILKTGLEKRLKIEITQVHTDDKSTKPPLSTYGNPDYAKGFDLVIHDECAAGITDKAVIAGVLKPHKDGLPGVNLHCAMHSYRFGDYQKPVAAGAENAGWFEYTGLQTTGHGAQLPIAIKFVDQAHAANAGLTDWSTGNEELYNNIQVMPNSKVLARGVQVSKNKQGEEKSTDNVVAWVNSYGEKNTRVWSTTIGHNNATVQDDRYLDMVANGIVWAMNRENLRK